MKNARVLAVNLSLILMMLVAVPFGSAISEPLTDQQIRERIIAQDIAAYAGNCPCPYNRASNGSRCGGRSAWSRPGGASPRCFADDVTDSAVRQFRVRLNR